MKNLTVVILLLFHMKAVVAQTNESPLLVDIFSKNQHPIFQKVINAPEKYKVQIIYTQIDRDENNIPYFKNHNFYLDSTHYFNPASTVKLPAALLALEKLHHLPDDITKDTWLRIDSAHAPQTGFIQDENAPEKKPTIAHLIKRAFLVSENEPYNRLYEFVGQKELNKRLWEMGYVDARIIRRFASFTEEQNRYTNPFVFLDEHGDALYEQPMEKNDLNFHFRIYPLIGKAHYQGGKLVQGGMDFTRANNLPLYDLQQVLQSVLFPESVPDNQRFNLSEEDYRFIYQYLSQFPGETNYPKYDATDFHPSYAKFFFKDSTHHELPTGVRVFNKVGWAYGFLTDASYVADFENEVEFMLSATVYVNEDEILNDGKYEYEEIGHPFLYQLGQSIYQYEIARKRKYLPDLNRFKVTYEKRKQDNRPTLREKEVDN
ncbi:serine hydrolase [Olivibacter sitiensis]|uniref:serine hydrolase n=1 Tax=Olivibacter sitiensis TaxID=376470 RepID=UPI0004216FD6|nr:serine hydrolase [Olivibacter sitiensis]